MAETLKTLVLFSLSTLIFKADPDLDACEVLPFGPQMCLSQEKWGVVALLVEPGVLVQRIGATTKTVLGARGMHHQICPKTFWQVEVCPERMADTSSEGCCNSSTEVWPAGV